MILNFVGDVLAECRTLGDDFVTANLTLDKLSLRRPVVTGIWKPADQSCIGR